MKRTLIYFIRYVVHGGIITTIASLCILFLGLRLEIILNESEVSFLSLWWSYFPKMITIMLGCVTILFIFHTFRIIRYALYIGVPVFHIELAYWEYKIYKIPGIELWSKERFNHWLSSKINESKQKNK